MPEVQTIKELCPGVYGFAYDDGVGLLRCEATTRYFFEAWERHAAS